jgi:predicted nucleic acid-binding protein
MIVLDANILIRAVLGRRVRQLIETYGSRGARFFAPDVAFGDAARYLPSLLEKRGKQDVDAPASLEYLRHVIEPVDREIYGLFENDWPVLATALGLACAVWTEDADFFGTGIATWTTNRVEIFLKAQANSAESQEG